MIAAIVIAAGYLAGSMPFGYWVVRAVRGDDIRSVGSGNIGASNVFRTYGPGLGIPVALFDLLKGLVPALLGAILVGDLTGVLAGGAAMLGHGRPLFLGFRRGGKMVATCGGAFLGVAPLVGLAGAGAWILAFVAFRYASVASMLAALSLPGIAVGLGEPWPVIAFAGVAAVSVIVLHRANIGRLLSGKESRFVFRRGKRAEAGV